MRVAKGRAWDGRIRKRRMWADPSEACRFVLTLWERESRFPPHAHDEAQVSLVLSGGLREEVRGASARVGAGAVLFKGAGVEHADEYLADGAIILKVVLGGPAGRHFARAAAAESGWAAAPDAAGAVLAAHVLGALACGRRVDVGADVLRPLAGVLREAATRRAPAPAWLASGLGMLERRLEDPPTAEDLADACGHHAKHVARVFRACFGQTVGVWRARRRVQEASTAMLHRGASQCQAAADAGFSDQAHMCRAFVRVLGVTPGQLVRAVRSASVEAERI
jgi:AraC family transcriptional regulator